MKETELPIDSYTEASGGRNPAMDNGPTELRAVIRRLMALGYDAEKAWRFVYHERAIDAAATRFRNSEGPEPGDELVER